MVDRRRETASEAVAGQAEMEAVYRALQFAPVTAAIGVGLTALVLLRFTAAGGGETDHRTGRPGSLCELTLELNHTGCRSGQQQHRDQCTHVVAKPRGVSDFAARSRVTLGFSP